MRDCIIIGGGPAGLTAALYLARFRRSVLILDGGDSRAGLIPKIRNLPGFPDGISGRAFLELLHRQLAPYPVSVLPLKAAGLTRSDEGFAVATADGPQFARTVILATGCADVRPELDDHDKAVEDGLLRYCPICDGYEVAGQRVGLVVLEEHAADKQDYLRTFTNELEVVTASPGENIRLERRDGGIALSSGSGIWDTAYAALGSKPRSDLAVSLGIDLTGDGCIPTDAHQQTAVEDIYAIGDVVSGLDQIAVALGHAAQAACRIHTALIDR